ncbi:MAG TPA: YhjD/YihY/BrkB family envelope integrity protein [Steroidobacteraceae bacterium]|nr:YhjD/YihY/BrkB family envelope integrity protein [Steroidobacteraceae bacterium]
MFNWVARVDEALFASSIKMAPPWGPVLRLLRYPAALVRDWFDGEITVRAMSLAYTTLLSFVPVISFAFVVLKFVGAHGNLRYAVFQFFRPLGSYAGELTTSVMQFVTNMRADVLGAIGIATLAYTVIATIQRVESSFQFVWRIDRPRSLARRCAEYAIVMVAGPILIAAAVGVLATERAQRTLRIDAPLLGDLLPDAIVTLAFLAMYLLIPNARVKFSAALTGAVAAGFVWALVSKAFTAFIFFSTQLLAIYTGFAIVVTTLIWVYLSWLILLFGAQLAFYIQYPQYLRHGQSQIELSGAARDGAGLTAIYWIGRDSALQNRDWTADRIASQLEVPSGALDSVLAALERAGLIEKSGNESFVPKHPLDQIRLIDVFDALRQPQVGRYRTAVHAAGPCAQLLAQIEAGARSNLADLTLQDLVDGRLDRIAAAAPAGAHAGSTNP